MKRDLSCRLCENDFPCPAFLLRLRAETPLSQQGAAVARQKAGLALSRFGRLI